MLTKDKLNSLLDVYSRLIKSNNEREKQILTKIFKSQYKNFVENIDSKYKF